MSNHKTPQAITVAATFTIEPILSPLQYVLHEAGLELDVRFSPYNQVFQELLTPASLLASNAGGINLVLLRVEDFIRETTDRAPAEKLIQRTIGQLLDALGQYARRIDVPTILGVLTPSPGLAEGLRRDIEIANEELTAFARSLPGIALMSQEEIDLVSTDFRYDSLSDELAHIPYTEEHYASLALAIVRKVHALRVPSHKVLLLDCDNTLWRGVVGEDGVDGITIPPALANIQRFATDVQARGALVCLVSKNAESDVLEVFEKRSDMILKKEHIVAHRINWEPKPNNIVSLGRFLNLGLDSFVYLDDSPVECALVRAELPEVVTLQVPADDEVQPFLSHLWTFDKIAFTDEDSRRTAMYRENAVRDEFERSAIDIAQFMASLNVVIDIAAPEENEWTRVSQLTQRTNQFNFTTVRRTESEMRALHDGGSIVLRVKVRDRFGDYGIVGVVVAQPRSKLLAIDILLLSCRVLGRGVEHAILQHLGKVAIERGLSHIEIVYLPTPQNEPARAFAEDVVGNYRRQDGSRVIYCVPAGSACAISHRPGHDPVAVIEAKKSEEKKDSLARAKSNTSQLGADQSQRYISLAQLQSGRDVLRAERRSSARVRSLTEKPKGPVTVTERRLLELWEETLGIDGLGVEDNYFALGGTSLETARLFAEVARQFGVRLPLTTILESPTVRELSFHLDNTQTERRESLIELKRGGQRNVFLIHDGDGETLLYLNLARRMPGDVTVIGVEPRRMAGVPLAHTRIEDMASFYIEQIRRKQPQGPYCLAGMCAGGVIAYEIALQLARSGEHASLVALLDAANPQAAKRPGRLTEQRRARLAQTLTEINESRRTRAGRAFALCLAMSRKVLGALKWELSHRAKRLAVLARFRLLRRILERGSPWPRYIPPLSVREIYDTAESAYTPESLPDSDVLLVRARIGEGGDTPYRQIYADETFGWDTVTNNIAVVDVEGGHSSMLQEPFVDSLAAALTRHLSRKPKPVQAHSQGHKASKTRNFADSKAFVAQS